MNSENNTSTSREQENQKGSTVRGEISSEQREINSRNETRFEKLERNVDSIKLELGDIKETTNTTNNLLAQFMSRFETNDRGGDRVTRSKSRCNEREAPNNKKQRSNGNTDPESMVDDGTL